MNIEQIIIRLGVDATAIKTGLGRAGSFVKAWGTSLVQDLKGMVGRLFIAGAAIEGLRKIKDEVLEISRVSKETGASTNFIQSLMHKAAEAGIPFEELTQGIARFNKTLGDAKMGGALSLKTLSDIGVATGITDVRTLTFTKAINNLGISFDKLGDKQKQAYLLQQAFGRSYAEFTPLFEQGARAIDKMSESNPFTKFQPETIGIFATAWEASKQAAVIVSSTIGNALGETVHLAYAAQQSFMRSGNLIYGWKYYTGLVKSDIESFTKTNNDGDEKSLASKELQAMAEKEGISAAELKTRILEQQASLLEKQAELTADIADRDKESVAEMADNARKLTGVKGPLEMMHTVTPRMRTALRIDTLEQRAKVANLRGNDAESNRLQTEADAIRKANPWLKRSDVNPMAKTEFELGNIKEALEPVTRAAELVNNDK